MRFFHLGVLALPAPTNPGELARAVPTWANFYYLLGLFPGGGVGTVTGVTGTLPITVTPATPNPNVSITDFVASGVGHARGTVPDPGAVAGTTKFLREDATWQLAGGASPLTTKGDLFGHSTVDARVPVGADDLPLVGDSGNALGVSYKVLPVDGGGTGLAALTAHNVILGEGTSSVALVAPAAAGTVMTSNGAAADPSFQSLASVPSSGVLARIAQVVCAGSQSTIHFGSIPSGYTSLKVVILGQDTKAASSDLQIRLMINSDAVAAHYTSAIFMDASGGAPSAGNQTPSIVGASIGSIPGVNGNANAFGTIDITIPNYSQTTLFKSAHSHGMEYYSATPTITMYMWGFMWLSAAAISDLLFTCGGTAFTNGTIATLYGMP